MRFVVYGAGAIGGVVGGRLFQHGHDVTLIARGEHLQKIGAEGLRIESPAGSVTLPIDSAAGPDSVSWTGEEMVLLTVKGQDSVGALAALRLAAPPSVSIACLQNGVANEQEALRRFANVYGVSVISPTEHTEPGLVRAWSHPVVGSYDIGRYPSGRDAIAESFAKAFNESGMASVVRHDIMRWKYMKLVMNMGNAAFALFGRSEAAKEVAEAARNESREVLDVAGISYASTEEDPDRRAETFPVGEIEGASYPGGSTAQSLARSQGSVETDLINGEIVLLGRLHGVPTPINERLQHWMATANAAGVAPGTMNLGDFMAEVSQHR